MNDRPSLSTLSAGAPADLIGHPRAPGETRDEIELFLRDAYAAGCNAARSRSLVVAMEYAAREAPKLRAILAAQPVSGNEGSDTPDDRALHRLAELLASSDDHGWSSNGVFSATLPTRSAAREIAEIVDALVDSALTPTPDCTSRNPSPLA